MNSLRAHTIEFPRLLCILRMAQAVSLTVELLNSVTSVSDNWFNFAMWVFDSKCFVIELVPCSDGWQRTWWQTIHMISGQPISSILQCKYNCDDDSCQEFFREIGRFGPISIEAHQASKMNWKGSSLKSWIKTRSFLEEIITSSNEMFKDCVSDMVVGIWKLGNPTWETAKSNIIFKQTAGS